MSFFAILEVLNDDFQLRLDFVEKFQFLLSLRFFLKSNIGELKRSNYVIFANFRDSELSNLVYFLLESYTNLLKIKI